MNISKLENAEAISLLTIIIANKIILNAPQNIIKDLGSSAWLNILYVGIITCLLGFFISKLLKKFNGLDILDISSFVGGTPLKIFVGITSILLMFIAIITTLSSFANNLKLMYFKESPILFLLLFFITASFIANLCNIKTIAKVNLIITPIVFFSVLFIYFSTSKELVVERLFPILGYGSKKTFCYGLTNLSAYTRPILFIVFSSTTKGF